jgi:hypothetical protein
MRNPWRSAVAASFLAVSLILTGPTAGPLGPAGAVAEPPPADPLAALNQELRATYARARAATLARTGPVILVDGDDLVLCRGKQRDRVQAVPALYHHLKACSHLPLAVYLSLADAEEGPLAPERLDGLRRLRGLAAAARAGLADRGFSPAQMERQKEILDQGLAFLDGVTGRGRCSAGELADFARASAPRLLANAADAARVQIDGYRSRVAAWRREVPAEEWARLRVVVIGSQMPRGNNVAVQYFARLVGELGEGPRVVYAEALYDEGRALNLLGTHLLDRGVAVAFFGDPQRMDRDLLGDAAAEYLRTLKDD